MHKLIIAEDDKWCREGLQNIDWKAYGVELCGVFQDGEGALLCHEKEAADIILTDIKMPKMDGITLLKRVKEVSRDTAVVLVSAYEDFQYAREAIEFEALTYITKPYSKQQIIKAVQRAVEKNSKPKAVTSIEKDYILSGVFQGKPQAIEGLLNLLKAKNMGTKFKGVSVIATKLPSGYEPSDTCIDFLDPYCCTVIDNIVYGLCIRCENMSRYALRGKLHGLDIMKIGSGVKIATGIEVGKLEDIKQSFDIANDGLDYIFFHYQTNIALYNDIKEVLEDTKKNRYIQISDVISYVKKGDIILLRDIFDRMRLACRVGHVDKDVVIMQFENILRQVDELLKQKGVFDHSREDGHALGFNNYDEMNEYVYSYCVNSAKHFSSINDYSPVVSSAVKYIIAHYDEDTLSLKCVAEAIGSSYNSLSRDFHKQVGTTFNKYLNKYRIHKAKELLKETLMPVNEICSRVGLQQKNFNRLFSQYEAITPSEFRKTH